VVLQKVTTLQLNRDAWKRRISREELGEWKRLLNDLKKERPKWSDGIDKLLEYLGDENMEEAQKMLTSER
jgi:hypothetical protein